MELRSFHEIFLSEGYCVLSRSFVFIWSIFDNKKHCLRVSLERRADHRPFERERGREIKHNRPLSYKQRVHRAVPSRIVPPSAGPRRQKGSPAPWLRGGWCELGHRGKDQKEDDSGNVAKRNYNAMRAGCRYCFGLNACGR